MKSEPLLITIFALLFTLFVNVDAEAANGKWDVETPSASTVWVWTDKIGIAGSNILAQKSGFYVKIKPNGTAPALPDVVSVTLYKRSLYFFHREIKTIYNVPIHNLLEHVKRSTYVIKKVGKLITPLQRKKYRGDPPVMKDKKIFWGIPSEKMKEGTYFLRVKDENGKTIAKSRMFKIIKERPKPIPPKLDIVQAFTLSPTGNNFYMGLSKALDENQELIIKIVSQRPRKSKRSGPWLDKSKKIVFTKKDVGNKQIFRTELPPFEFEYGVFLEVSIKTGFKTYILKRTQSQIESKASNWLDSVYTSCQNICEEATKLDWVNLFQNSPGVSARFFGFATKSIVKAAFSGKSKQ